MRACIDAQLEKDFVSPQSGTVVAPSGSTLPSSPSSMLSLTLDNTWQFGSMNLTVGVNGYYQSKTQNFINKTSALNESFDSFWIWNATLQLNADQWYAVLYAKNLGNEEAITGSFPCSYWCNDTGTFENWYGNGNREFIAQPRTVGLSLGYKF